MALTDSITFRGLLAADAFLRVMNVQIQNGKTDRNKTIKIRYAIWADQTAYNADETPLDEGQIGINKEANPTEFSQFLTKMRELNEDIISAAYVAVKQLAEWSNANDVDPGDE